MEERENLEGHTLGCFSSTPNLPALAGSGSVDIIKDEYRDALLTLNKSMIEYSGSDFPENGDNMEFITWGEYFDIDSDVDLDTDLPKDDE